jgi:hypothetical protein
MATKKQLVKQEPLLNIVARKVGRAAGKLTNVTQELTESLSALPDTVTSKLSGAGNPRTTAERRQPSARRPKKSVRSASRSRTKAMLTSTKRRPPKKKSPR